MSNLERYIEKIRKYIDENENITELELVRYIYIDLGKRFFYDVDFSFANTKERKTMARALSKDVECLTKYMDERKIVCKTLCYILEYILKKFDVDIKTEASEDNWNIFSHAFNIITTKDGKKYKIDLQADLANIQSHSATKHFGMSPERKNTPVIPRFQLEQIDRKIGYIDSENYYSDDYLYTMKADIDLFDNFDEKVDFVLENLEIYDNPEMKYAERKWHHEKLIKKLFSDKERNKIHFIDCYTEKEMKREYLNCISVDTKNGSRIYIYSKDLNGYRSIEFEEFAKKIQSHELYTLEKINGLSKVLKKLKNYDCEEEKF